jgi:hypothetical protein
MRQPDDVGDIREFRQQLGPGAGSDLADSVCGAVDRVDEHNRVARARPLAPPAVAHKGAPLGRRRDLAHVSAELIVEPHIADGQVVGVNVVARCDRVGRKANHLAVAPHRLAHRDGAQRNLVARVDIGREAHRWPARRDLPSGGQRH